MKSMSDTDGTASNEPSGKSCSSVTGDDQPLLIRGKADLTYQLKERLKDVRADQLVMTRRDRNLELCFGCKIAGAHPEIVLENHYEDDCAAVAAVGTTECRDRRECLSRLGEMSGLCVDLEDGASVYYRLGDGNGPLTATTSLGVWPLLLDLLGMAEIAAVIAQRYARKEALSAGVSSVTPASSMRMVVMPVGRHTAA
jgi:hypothetical protein